MAKQISAGQKINFQTSRCGYSVFFSPCVFIFLPLCFFLFFHPTIFHFLFGCIFVFFAGVFFLRFLTVHIFSIFTRVYVSYVR